MSTRASEVDGAASRELADRAVLALGAAPGGLSDAALAQALFGASAGATWGPMLTRLIGGDGRIVRQHGHWLLTAPPTTVSQTDLSAPEATGGRIVALALATTGADPGRHRIARIAVVALSCSEIVARFDSPVQTGGRVAGYLRTATRSNADELDESPALEQVLQQLRPILDGQTAYVYGARRAEAFIKAEARRAGLPPFPITLVEADHLLRTHLPANRKPGLIAAARELGAPYGQPGLPLADAEALARVIERLRQRQSASPARPVMAPDLGEDDNESSRQPPRPLPFTRAWLNYVPDGPGVYVFEDGSGRPLYVGKARSLSRRLGDYIRRQPGANRQLEALAVRTVSVITRGTPSDLEAALLEARMIREHQPEFNVAREARPPRTVIRAGPDEQSPRLQLVAEIATDGARYFGPLESNRAARSAVDTVRAVYPAAFARKRGDVAVQREAVLNACRLLAGQKTPALNLLRERMQQAAASGDQTEVDRLRAALKAVQALDVRPSMLAGLPSGTQLLVLEHVFEGVSRTHLIQDGQRLVSVSWGIDFLPSDPGALREFAASMLAAAETAGVPDFGTGDADEDVSAQPEPSDPNEPAQVMRWLVQAWARVELARVPPPDAPVPRR